MSKPRPASISKSHTKRRRIVIASFCLAAAAAIAAYLTFPRLGTPVIGLYGADQASEAAIRQIAEARKLVDTRFAIVRMDEKRSPASQISRRSGPDLVIGLIGSDLEGSAAAFETVDGSSLASVTGTMRSLASREGRIFALPLEIDPFEVAYRKEAFPVGKLPPLRTLGELEDAARRLARSGSWPIACAGGDDTTLFMLLGSLAEATGTLTAYRELAAALSSRKPLEEILGKRIGVDAGNAEITIKSLLSILVAWNAKGLIHPSWFAMQASDVEFLMKSKKCSIAFMPLSMHRSFATATLSAFASRPFPAKSADDPRSIVANVLVACVPAQAPRKSSGAAFAAALVGGEGQAMLTKATGLGPVNSTVEAADEQASDARLWSASAQATVGDPGRAAGLDPSQRAALAQELRDYLLVERGRRPR